MKLVAWQGVLAMFGKPQWFRPKAYGWGLAPVAWQGKVYSGCWAAVLAVPFVILLSRGQVVESLVWLALSTGALFYDVRQILRLIRNPPAAASTVTTSSAPREDNVLYILDDDETHHRVATPGYRLHTR
jgi:hypothetical protein